MTDSEHTPARYDNPVFDEERWQMSLGERAALEGLLSALRPGLSVEIGSAEGGSLSRIAHHSGEVHAFDFDPPDAVGFPNVVFHAGDSHILLPRLLRDLERDQRRVDFVLVDGDHSEGGVAQDLRDLLASPAVSKTVIVLHDTMNEAVRAGVMQSGAPSHRNVSYMDLGFIELAQDKRVWEEGWSGLGLIVVDEDRSLTPRAVRAASWWDVPIRRSVAWRAAGPLRTLRRRTRSRVVAAARRFRGPRQTH